MDFHEKKGWSFSASGALYYVQYQDHIVHEEERVT